MPAAIDDKLWAKIKAAYMVDTTQTNGSVAKRFKVSKSAVDKRAAAEGWKTERDATQITTHAIAVEVAEQLQKPIPPASVRAAYTSNIDISKLYDDALSFLDAACPGAEIKSAEGGFATMVKIAEAKQKLALSELERQSKEVELELRRTELELKKRQLNPPTLGELVEYVIKLGYSHVEFVQLLKKQWGKETGKEN